MALKKSGSPAKATQSPADPTETRAASNPLSRLELPDDTQRELDRLVRLSNPGALNEDERGFLNARRDYLTEAERATFKDVIDGKFSGKPADPTDAAGALGALPGSFQPADAQAAAQPEKLVDTNPEQGQGVESIILNNAKTIKENVTAELPTGMPVMERAEMEKEAKRLDIKGTKDMSDTELAHSLAAHNPSLHQASTAPAGEAEVNTESDLASHPT